MKTYLVTGAAGFIGANFIKHMLAKYDDIKIVVLDLLTYAGNLGTIAEDIDGVRCEFVKGDICDRALADQLFEKYNFFSAQHFDGLTEGQNIICIVLDGLVSRLRLLCHTRSDKYGNCLRIDRF